MEKMNYNEFKAAICANCKDKEPAFPYACNYECDLHDAYGVYLTLLDEIDTLVSKCKELIDSANWAEDCAEEHMGMRPDSNLDDCFRFLAKRKRDKAVALLPVICRKQEKLALFMEDYNLVTLYN